MRRPKEGQKIAVPHSTRLESSREHYRSDKLDTTTDFTTECKALGKKVKRCALRGCSKYPSFGVECPKRVEYCSEHVIGCMVRVVSKRCFHGDYRKRPLFGAEG